MKPLFSPLGDLAEFINGAAFKPEDWGDDGVRIIRIQNLTDKTKPFNRTTRAISDKLHVHPGDLLVSWSASLGVFEWEEPDIAYLNQHIFRVVPNLERVEKRYLRHALNSALVGMQRHLHGATMQHVNRGEFLGTRIYLPPLAEQKRIAAILDAADALRAKRRAGLAKLDQLAQSIFIEMFGDAAQLNDADFHALGDDLTFVTSGGRGWAQYYAPHGSRFIRSFDVQMNYLSVDDPVFVNAPDNAEARRTRVQQDDVLLTITGSKIGRVSPVNEESVGAFISQHVAILRPDTKKLLPTYLSYFLSLPTGGQRQISKAQYGQAKPGLNFDQIRSFQVRSAPVKAQQVFCDRLSETREIKFRAAKSLAQTEALFASLQHRAFKGEL